MNQITCPVGAEIECFVFDDFVFAGNSNSIGKTIITINIDNNESYNTFADNKQRSLSVGSFKDVDILSIEQYGRGKYPIRKKQVMMFHRSKILSLSLGLKLILY